MLPPVPFGFAILSRRRVSGKGQLILYHFNISKKLLLPGVAEEP